MGKVVENKSNKMEKKTINMKKIKLKYYKFINVKREKDCFFVRTFVRSFVYICMLSNLIG